MIIDGAVAFIAGGAGGFGAATARRLHAAGRPSWWVTSTRSRAGPSPTISASAPSARRLRVGDDVCRGRAGRGYGPPGALTRGRRPNRCMKTSAVLACCS